MAAMTQKQSSSPPLSARAVALEGLTRVLFKSRPLDSFFDDIAKDLSTADRAFAKALLWGTLRHHGAISALQEGLLEHPLPERARRASLIITLGLAELLVVRAVPHAAVNEAVTMAKASKDSFRYAGLINAVLRRVSRSIDQMGEKLAGEKLKCLPQWLRDRWEARYGPEGLEKLAAAVSDIPPLDVTAKSPDVAEKLAAEPGSIRLTASSIRFPAGDPRRLAGYDAGDFWVQDLAASLAVGLMPVKPGDRVLDMCAAPGGKTLQLAALGADVTAIDRSKQRMKRVAENLERTGLKATLCVENGTRHQPETLYDHILLDVPCTALGTYRRNPDILHFRKESDVAGVAHIQSSLLNHAATLLKPGGTLVYCVCSTEPEEGSARVSDFLGHTPDMAIDPVQRTEIGLRTADFPDDLIAGDGTLSPLPSMLADLPEGQRGLDGFFIARLLKS